MNKRPCGNMNCVSCVLQPLNASDIRQELETFNGVKCTPTLMKIRQPEDDADWEESTRFHVHGILCSDSSNVHLQIAQDTYDELQKYLPNDGLPDTIIHLKCCEVSIVKALHGHQMVLSLSREGIHAATYYPPSDVTADLKSLYGQRIDLCGWRETEIFKLLPHVYDPQDAQSEHSLEQRIWYWEQKQRQQKERTEAQFLLELEHNVRQPEWKRRDVALYKWALEGRKRELAEFKLEHKRRQHKLAEFELEVEHTQRELKRLELELDGNPRRPSFCQRLWQLFTPYKQD